MDDKFCRLFDFPELGGQILLLKVLDDDNEPHLEVRSFVKGNSAVSSIGVEPDEIDQYITDYTAENAERHYRGLCGMVGKPLPAKTEG